jgi:flagellin
MRINNNLMAMNTHRQLGINANAGSKSIEKLSSGYRINRAGDDAAGLAISEKMRGQIRGLNQASRNSQDSISLIQTAEGALNETQAILQRMRELAVQSANDTNVSGDREAIQNEVNELTKEITRIADSTEFNTQKLLDGQFEGTFQIGANEGQNMDLTIADMDAAALGVEGNNGLVQEGFQGTTDLDASGTLIDGAAVGDKFDVVKLGETQTVGGTADVQYLLKDSDSNIVGISTDGATYTLVGDDATATSVISDVALGTSVDIDLSTDFTTVVSGQIEITGLNAQVDGSQLDIKADATLVADPELSSGTYTLSDSVPLPAGAALALLDENGTAVAYDDGANAWTDTAGNDLFGGVVVDMGAAGDEVVIGGDGVDISTQASASTAITTINDAISSVSAERAKLGAVQNRLEHTIKNLDTSSENLQASESRIRDVDMAKEMMEFTKNNILQQAAQSMLAQANQAPQGVLQLLR